MAADDYRPLSGWAIAGFGLAGLYTLTVVVSGLVGYFQGAPLFLPGWTFAFAVGGLLLSWIGQRSIRAAEGILAGAALAQWGIWLSLFAGAGYFAFQFATGLALASQAHAFLVEKEAVPSGPLPDAGFIPRLRAGASDLSEFHRAYLLTLPSRDRTGNPTNEKEMKAQHDQPIKDGPGRLTLFRLHPLVQMLLHPEVVVEPLGVHDWTYENKSYQVWRNYRLTTPEVTEEFLLLVQSVEGQKPGEPRKWFLALPRAQRRGPQWTELGRNLQALRDHYKAYLIATFAKPGEGDAVPFGRNLAADWQTLVADAKARSSVQERLEKYFRGAYRKEEVSVDAAIPPKAEGAPWKLVEGKLRLSYPFSITFPAQMGQAAVRVEGYLVGQTKDAMDPKTLAGIAVWEPVQTQVERVVWLE